MTASDAGHQPGTPCAQKTPGHRPEGVDPRHTFLAQSGWLDEDWYRSRASTPVLAGEDPISHYLSHGAPLGIPPNAGTASLQGFADPGSAAAPPPYPYPHTSEPEPRQLELEVALVRDSGLFDARFYREGNPQELPDDADPLRHFCQIGWRELRRPNRDFDVWWYWSQHLDPAQEVLNPFVHYLLLGRAAGLGGRPADVTPRVFADLPGDRTPRRICLFAAYDRDGVVDETTTAYVTELSRFADVYFLADQYLAPAELEKLEKITRGAWGIRHGEYDFGSYSMLARELVGWDLIEKYDELLLVNDSCYLLDSLDDLFETMSRRSCSWWGLQATKGLAITRDRARAERTEPVPMGTVRDQLLPEFEDDAFYDFHVGSYFLAFRAPVVADPAFRRLLDSVHEQPGKLAIIQKYEIGITRCLIGAGYSFDTYVNALYPFHPLFTEWYFELLANGFPLLKKYLLYQNHYDVPDLAAWKERIRAARPDAPVDALERNLTRTSPDDRLRRSFSVTTDSDGRVNVPQPLTPEEFRPHDVMTPTFAHWWAFPVNARTHRLPTSSRAIFETVRDDPAIRKVVLTRSRRVEVEGENVTVLPLESREGQEQLLRCGPVFVDQHRRQVLRRPFSHTLHDLILVRDGLTLQRLGSAKRPEPPRHEEGFNAFRGIPTTSQVDQLAVLADNYPATYEVCWRTGLPATDLVLCDDEALPADMQAQQQRLRRETAGRRLLLFAPGCGRSVDHVAYQFSPAELRRLEAWAEREDVVIGVREHPADLHRSYMRQLEDFALDLSLRDYPDRAILLRHADAVLTDVDGAALDFLVTGRPVVSFVHDLPDVADDLFFDLEHVLPRPVARTFGELSDQLESVWDTGTHAERERYECARRLFHDTVDTDSSRRVVDHLRTARLVGDAR